MQKLGGSRRGSAGQIALLAEKDRKSTARGVPGDAATVDAPADDGDVVSARQGAPPKRRAFRAALVASAVTASDLAGPLRRSRISSDRLIPPRRQAKPAGVGRCVRLRRASWTPAPPPDLGSWRQMLEMRPCFNAWPCLPSWPSRFPARAGLVGRPWLGNPTTGSSLKPALVSRVIEIMRVPPELKSFRRHSLPATPRPPATGKSERLRIRHSVAVQ